MGLRIFKMRGYLPVLPRELSSGGWVLMWATDAAVSRQCVNPDHSIYPTVGLAAHLPAVCSGIGS